MDLVKTIIVILLSTVFYSLTNGQTSIEHGRQATCFKITNEKEMPLKFVAIKILNKGLGGYTNEHGILHLQVEQSDSVLIQSLGHEQKFVGVSNVFRDTIIVILKEKGYNLSEIFIFDKRKKTYQSVSNYKRHAQTIPIVTTFGSILVSQIKIPEPCTYLHSVSFYLSKTSKADPSGKFRLVAYEVGANQQPGEQIILNYNAYKPRLDHHKMVFSELNCKLPKKNSEIFLGIETLDEGFEENFNKENLHNIFFFKAQEAVPYNVYTKSLFFRDYDWKNTIDTKGITKFRNGEFIQLQNLTPCISAEFY